MALTMNAVVGETETERQREARAQRRREARAHSLEKFRRGLASFLRGLLIFTIGATIFAVALANSANLQNFFDRCGQSLASRQHSKDVLRQGALKHENEVDEVLK